MDGKVVALIEGGLIDGKEVRIARGVSSLAVPVAPFGPRNFGSFRYRPTGRFSEGREIWAPEHLQ